MKKFSGLVTITTAFVVIVLLVFTQRSSARKIGVDQVQQNVDAQEQAARKKELAKRFTDQVSARPADGQTAQRRLRTEAQMEGSDNDPDLAPDMFGINKEAYLKARADQIAMQRGIDPDKPFDQTLRVKAVEQMEAQEGQMIREGTSNKKWRPADYGVAMTTILGAFTSIGPNFLPNGQTDTTSSAVSGRLTSIDIHPTNANIAYVGAAQGGVWRTLDGGATWTPILDNAQTLAIGAVTIDPVTPSTVFVGTGEGNNNSDGYPGVGIYIIKTADTTPVVTGPFQTRIDGSGTTAGTAVNAFLNSSITRIAVDPNNDNRIFVGNNISFSGNPGVQVPNIATTGLYFSDNAQSATPTFSKVGPVAAGSYLTASNQAPVVDVVFEPGSSDNLLFLVDDRFGLGNGGVYRTTNATAAPAAAPTITKTLTIPVNINGRLAIQKTGTTVTVYEASGESHTQPQPASPVFCADVNGVVRKSVDGGVTWSTPLPDADGFCWQQCFYDIALDVDPTNANNVHLGGWANSSGCDHIYEKSTNGTNFTASEIGLHADTHLVKVAPSTPATVWFGSDGGIFKSVDTGGTWVSQNPNGISALQFQSVSAHPTNRNYTIGGTQDNGTPRRDDTGVWNRADLGDGGYALIDQSSTDVTANMRIYHTRFAQTNAFTYQRALTGAQANDNLWESRGCGFTGSVNNGFGQAGGATCPTGAVGEVSCPCKATTSVLFYPPMALGPLSPNSLYYGTDRLWRSTDNGATMSLVSQNPITSGIAVTTIATESTTGLTLPRNDNIRLVGLRNGTVFGTITGSSTLVTANFTPPTRTPASTTNRAVGRVAIDPTNPNVAYLTLAYYQPSASFSATTSPQVWKTTNLNVLGTGTVTWSPAGNGIPNIPVNAFVVDSAIPNNLYAGTDIGVYASTDGGATWLPFGTGLPKVAVFDMAIARAESSPILPPVLRVATHGRGMYEAQIPIPTNTAPVASATPNPATTNEDTAVAITLQGTDIDDNNLTFTITASPTNGTLSAISAPDCTPVNTCTASVTYTPNANYNGADSFKFKANDGTVDSNEVTVNITVNAVADLSINDVSQVEGNTGTSTFAFTVSLDSPAPAGGVTFLASTADGTANAGSDYVPLVNQPGTITAGNTSTTVNVTVNGDTTGEANETFFVNISSVTNATVADGQGQGTILNDDSAPAAGQLIISEFRLRGSAGANDEFIELYNTQNLPLTVTSSDGSAGLGVAASDGTLRCTVPNTTVIPARGHFLCANNTPTTGYSLGSYPSGNNGTSATTATPDATYTTDIPDNVGIALFSSTTTFSAATVLDAVGSTTEANSLYKEGTGYPALNASILSTGSVNYSFYRDMALTGVPKDTGNNSADFLFTDPNGTQAGAGQHLGAPGPENLSAPVNRGSTIKATLIDPGCTGVATAPTQPCPRYRDFTSDPANNSTFGTLSIRRRFTNNTGQTVTRLRFRIVDITTFPQGGGGTADVRARTSPDQPATCLGAGAGCASVGSPITIRGTTLEEALSPNNQPNGGGYNSSLSAGTINLASALVPGDSINVQFLLGIQTTGNFRFFVTVEALPNPVAPNPPAADKATNLDSPKGAIPARQKSLPGSATVSPAKDGQ
jgi:hypothetical protein